MSMKITVTLVRLFVIYYFMTNLNFILSTLVYLLVRGAVSPEILLIALINFSVCVLLFVFPAVILLGVRFPKEQETNAEEWIKLVQPFGVALVGLYFAMEGLQTLINYHVLWLRTPSFDYGSSNNMAHSEYWSAVFGVVAGLVLIATSGGIAKFFSWLRDLGPRVD